MTINLAESEVYFSPNKLNAFPQDFLIKNYQFGWDNKGQLKALAVVGITANTAALEAGILIHRIDNYTVEQLLKKPTLINEIKLKAKEEPIAITVADNKIITL